MCREQTARDLLLMCRRSCTRRGFPVARDPEFGSAVGWGVAEAMRQWTEETGCSMETLARRFSLRECVTAALVIRRTRLLDDDPSIEERVASKPLLSETEFSALEVAATFGRVRAAKLLGTSPRLLRELLDRCVEEVNRCSRP